MDPKGQERVRETLLLNRVKILKFCDYFILSAPLIARKILPLDKHKELKNRVGLGPGLDLKAANNARLDALLEFMDECSTPGAFDAFVEGVKECEGQKAFARTLKLMGEGKKGRVSNVGGAGEEGEGKPKAKAKAKVGLKRPLPPPPSPPSTTTTTTTFLPYSTLPIPPTIMQIQSPSTSTGLGGMGGVGGPKGVLVGPTLPLLPPPKTKAKKTTAPKKTSLQNGPGPSVPLGGSVTSGPSIPTTPLLKPTPPLPPTPSSTPKQTPKRGGGGGAGIGSVTRKETKSGGGGKKPTPKNKAQLKLNGQQGQGQGGVILKLEGNPLTAKKKKSGKGGGETKVVSLPPIPVPSLVGLSVGGSGVGGFRVPPGSPFRRRSVTLGGGGGGKVKKMTFQEVEEKQKSVSRATTFTFLNPSALVKTIHFNNKSDLFYEGCPSKTNHQLCAKKVQLIGKGKKYVCKDKHENESYELFPRLYVTFQDETTHMQTTLYRENVEMLAGKSVTEIHRMDDQSLKTEFLRAHNKNIPIQVKSKKVLKKDLKKSGGASWENVASIMTEGEEGAGAPPAKRSRKSTD